VPEDGSARASSLAGSLRHLDDAQFGRLRDAIAPEARQRGVSDRTEATVHAAWRTVVIRQGTDRWTPPTL